MTTKRTNVKPLDKVDRYHFQPTTVRHLLNPPRPDGWKVCTNSPTGTGKSHMIMALQKELGVKETIVLLPTPEIMPDFIEKLGLRIPDSKPAMVALGNKHNIYSTLDLRNKIGYGKLTNHIRNVIPDEAHHDDADTYQQIYAGLPSSLRRYGFTATPYCGTPRATHKFRSKWDEFYQAITLDDALASGVITYPEIVVEPLVNDDVMEVGSSGEFVIRQVESQFENKIEHALHLTLDRGWWINNGRPTKTTIFGCPSSKCFEALSQYSTGILSSGLTLRVEYITQLTTYAQRQKIFRAFKMRKCAIAHINVVSEGKDLPVRNYLDMRPMVSPRLFFQIFGRCTRPLGLLSDGRMETLDDLGMYLCTNRNIERHCYLFDMTLPAEQVKKAVAAFPETSKRTGVRAFGIESLGRIKPTSIELSSGLTITIYNVTQVQNGKKETFLCLLHPQKSVPIWFKQEAGLVRDGALQRMAYERWKYIQPPTELRGFSSSKPRILTEKQLNTWRNHAEGKGLKVEQKMDAKKYALLPVLIHSGVSFA